jgi:hypothetical protein
MKWLQYLFRKHFFGRLLSIPGAFLMLALPASTNYQLKDFGYGGGGVANGTSSSYALEGIAGEQNAGQLTGATYDIGPGLQFTNQANVPPAPAFTNPSSYYNKLKIVLDTGSNPSDTLFAIAISTDSFVSDTRYVQSDATVGSTLGIEDYQTYTSWGGASGTLIIGLTSGTTYQVKVKAMQGKFTETGYGPTASAATVSPQMTFDIDVSASDTETGPPFTTNFGNLIASTVTDSPEKIWVDFTTNGESGGRVYVYGSNAGLASTRAAYTISAVTGNLTSLSEGFGAQGSSATQSAGGPFAIATAYSLSSNNVAITDTTIREIFTTTSPTTDGRGSFLLKAKSSAVTPAASDYTESLTVIASASF